MAIAFHLQKPPLRLQRPVMSVVAMRTFNYNYLIRTLASETSDAGQDMPVTFSLGNVLDVCNYSMCLRGHTSQIKHGMPN